jgi:hypothetical protein
MRINRRIGAAIAGSVLALATAIPAAQAIEVDAAHHSTSSKSAQAQTLRAIKAEFKANADFMKARAQAAQALRAGGWYTEAGTAR